MLLREGRTIHKKPSTWYVLGKSACYGERFLAILRRLIFAWLELGMDFKFSYVDLFSFLRRVCLVIAGFVV